jgi:small subunit ribosomal protein S4
LESQFHKYYEMALKQAGVTGDNLLRILESRLDNIVYRAGFANSRAEARQLVTHRHFSVNGKIVNIPSYLMKAGDVLSVRHTDLEVIKGAVEANSARPTPVWMEVDTENLTAKVVKLPDRSEIDFDIEEHYIIELYSK